MIIAGHVVEKVVVILVGESLYRESNYCFITLVCIAGFVPTRFSYSQTVEFSQLFYNQCPTAHLQVIKLVLFTSQLQYVFQ